MKNLSIWVLACLVSISVFASWKPDEKAAVFSLKPDQLLGSPYFNEVLNTYGLLGFGYNSIVNNHHLVDLQKEMGVQIKEASEVSFIVGNFLETMVNFPVSTSGNYQALNNSSFTFILRTKGEMPPNTLFEKFDRWASGPAFNASEIERFRRDTQIEPDAIDEMSKRPRIKKELYLGMEKSEKIGEAAIFSMPMSAIDNSFQKMGMKKIKIVLGMQSEKNATTFALGSRKNVLAFFEHKNHSTAALTQPESSAIAKFSVPMDGELLRQMEANKLSEPNGPLGPLATTLGDAAYQVEEISGTAKFSGGRAHLDLVVSCKDVQSAQSIWSVGQASLGMAQLNIMRQQFKNPAAQTAVSIDFLNRIRLKHQEANVVVHVEASPKELFPWAVKQ